MNELYAYDSTDQVTGVTYGSGRVVGYQYDPLGNLTQKVDNGTADNYTANSLNQYTFINSQALSYDAKGNLLQRPGWAYTWDAHNRLRSAAPASPQSGSLRLTFSYDGRNRCAIRRTYTWTSDSWLLTSSAYLTYSDWNLLEERDVEGTLVAAYIHGPGVDDVVARLTPTSTLYYHADAQHSTVAVTGAQGDVLERYTYDIFGLPTVRDGASYAALTATAVGNRLLFHGREWLAEIKLTDHRNRLYSPEMHRWLNRDPISERGGLNLYGFVKNLPVNRTDPTGEAGAIALGTGIGSSLCPGIGTVVGFVIGVVVTIYTVDAISTLSTDMARGDIPARRGRPDGLPAGSLPIDESRWSDKVHGIKRAAGHRRQDDTWVAPNGEVYGSDGPADVNANDVRESE